jgi:hypothetical protein
MFDLLFVCYRCPVYITWPSITANVIVEQLNPTHQIPDMSNRSNLPYDGYGPSKQSDNTAYSISHDYEPLANRHQSRQLAYSMQQPFQEHNVGYGAFQPTPGQVEQSQARNSGYGPAMQEDYLGENACAPEVVSQCKVRFRHRAA